MDTGKLKRLSKSKRAGLNFSVARCERNLRKGRYTKRISVSSSVYLAAVLEYVTVEVVELSTDTCVQNKKKLIDSRHIMLAIENDPELKELLSGVIPHAGRPVNIITYTKSKKRPDDPTASAVVQSQEI